MKQTKITSFFNLNHSEPSTSKLVKKTLKKKDLFIYTDGACSNNGKVNAKGGIGIFFKKNDKRNYSKKINIKPTNNKCELLALINAIKIIEKNIKTYNNIYIYTDSKYCINCVTKWFKKWEKNNFLNSQKKKVKNKNLIITFYNLLQKYNNIKLKYIKAHTNLTDIHSVGNSAADFLATNVL